jgi:MFS superfamily sulfate permease-like transporter
MVAATIAVPVFDLEAAGVKTVGAVPAGLPSLQIPTFPPDLLDNLFADAAGLALISFASMMLTARSFAAKNQYDVDADRELAALGAANLAAALSQSFAVSGADSRTAMNDAAGGRTQVAGLVAAAVIAAVLLFITGPLRYVPTPALGAVLVMAGWSLIDVRSLRFLWRVDRTEFALAMIAMLGVVAVGAIKAVLVVVALTLLRFIHLTARPPMEILGQVSDLPGFHDLDRHPGATTVPGLVIFRFNGPLVFFNAAHFKRGVLAAIAQADPAPRWLVIDMVPVTLCDASGLQTAMETFRGLRARGITVALAGRMTEWLEWLDSRGWPRDDIKMLLFATLRHAFKAFQAAQAPSTPMAQSP